MLYGDHWLGTLQTTMTVHNNARVQRQELAIPRGAARQSSEWHEHWDGTFKGQAKSKMRRGRSTARARRKPKPPRARTWPVWQSYHFLFCLAKLAKVVRTLVHYYYQGVKVLLEQPPPILRSTAPLSLCQPCGLARPPRARLAPSVRSSLPEGCPTVVSSTTLHSPGTGRSECLRDKDTPATPNPLALSYVERG